MKIFMVSNLTVEFLTFIRGEKKFDNFALLAEQIKKDIQVAKDYHSKKNKWNIKIQFSFLNHLLK